MDRDLISTHRPAVVTGERFGGLAVKRLIHFKFFRIFGSLQATIVFIRNEEELMYGPVRLIRSKEISNYRNLEPVYEWKDRRAYLIIDKVLYQERPGAILCYHNPPVHQIGTTSLHAYHAGLDRVLKTRDELEFLLLCGANDPVHSGGDLKESLAKLRESLDKKREKVSRGASEEDIDRLFSWGERRLKKGVVLYEKIRNVARAMRVVGLCGGGLRFGGSAEIPLMADYLIGDSRSGMCFSEAMIGIIPGWGGITRIMVKAGKINGEYMAKTARPVYAHSLESIGVYNEVVEVPFSFPSKGKTGDPDKDGKRYNEALEEHNDNTAGILLPAALHLAVLPKDEIPTKPKNEKEILATREEISREVSRRVDPRNYSHLWGKTLKAVKKDIAALGRPLAPQSIEAIDLLLNQYDESEFDELQFAGKELEVDALLYRDPRFLEGLTALLDQRVPDFRFPGHPLQRETSTRLRLWP
ncbi:MAG: enoyl-CoA hydratase-related protein [Pseudomonadota bacterium]